MVDRLADRWADRDLPVLREVVRLMDENPGAVVKVDAIAQALPHLDSIDIERAGIMLSRGGYVEVKGALQRRVLVFSNVSERALRVTGLWPDDEQAADQLLWVLEQKVEQASNPAEKTRWIRLRDAVVAGGRDFTIELAAAVTARSIGA